MKLDRSKFSYSINQGTVVQLGSIIRFSLLTRTRGELYEGFFILIKLKKGKSIFNEGVSKLSKLPQMQRETTQNKLDS